MVRLCVHILTKAQKFWLTNFDDLGWIHTFPKLFFLRLRFVVVSIKQFFDWKHWKINFEQSYQLLYSYSLINGKSLSRLLHPWTTLIARSLQQRSTSQLNWNSPSSHGTSSWATRKSLNLKCSVCRILNKYEQLCLKALEKSWLPQRRLEPSMSSNISCAEC